jgi:hypothetical protein
MGWIVVMFDGVERRLRRPLQRRSRWLETAYFDILFNAF